MNKYILGAVLLASVGAGVFLAPKETVYQTCASNKQELQTVADIANATGQLPNGVRLQTGAKVSVNPNLCQATFDAPTATHKASKELQGNDNTVQATVDPQL